MHVFLSIIHGSMDFISEGLWGRNRHTNLTKFQCHSDQGEPRVKCNRVFSSIVDHIHLIAKPFHNDAAVVGLRSQKDVGILLVDLSSSHGIGLEFALVTTMCFMAS